MTSTVGGRCIRRPTISWMAPWNSCHPSARSRCTQPLLRRHLASASRCAVTRPVEPVRQQRRQAVRGCCSPHASNVNLKTFMRDQNLCL